MESMRTDMAQDSEASLHKPETDSDIYVMPATPSQMRFWSVHQLHPGNHALNMPLAWTCRGKLDRELVAATLTELVSRHESLRTTFDVIEGKLSQVIRPPFSFPVPLEDLRSLPPEARKRRAAELIRKEARIQMDMKNGPLFFGRLLRMDEEEHILMITIHHSVCDGWSNGVVLRDFASIYDGLTRHVEPDLPELAIQFGDFAVWLDEWRSGDEPAASLEYWRKTLGGDFTPLVVPHDFPGSQAEDEGEIETFLLSPEMVQRTRHFCATEDVTMYMLLFSVFAATLYRTTGQEDFLIGSPSANRPTGTEDLIGPFSNPQVIRIRMQSSDTFRELLHRVRDWTLGAVTHQVYPFEDLIDDAFFSEAKNRINLQVYFLYQKAFMQAQHKPSIDITPIRSVSPGTMFDLMLGVVERTEGPRLQLEYNPGFFRVSTIRRFLRIYVQLLDRILTDAGRQVEKLDVLAEEDRRQILEEWNRTEQDFGPFESVYRRIERRAAQVPSKIAAICNGEEWTYQQLNEYSNRVARYLQHEGVTQGSVVGICLQRSLPMVGAVLGILKAGAAYLPLDPSHPIERLQLILEGAQVKLLLADEQLATLLPTQARIVSLTGEQSLLSRESAANLPNEVSASSLAYVIYTSGSTGHPKGVAIEHGPLTNLLHSMEREPGLNDQDVLVSITTLAFDIATMELLLPLTVGAKLVVATRDQVRDGNKLLQLLQDSHATVLQSTPGTWRMLIEAGWKGQPRLKILCGGEAMPRDLADSLLERSPEVWNLYGPTETTIWSSATRLTAQSPRIRVGPPIANTQFYLLDAHHQPVPIGATGELYIAGAGLARGYWNCPELTEERFVPNLFGPGRMYRTGDLGRWQEDGHIDLLGRVDHQVKIYGYRIELAEIEATLAMHTAVRDAVVIAVEDKVGNKRLAAYVDSSLENPPEDLSNQLLALLTSKLPDYMIPAAITVLGALPRTPNGKIDRNALPVPRFTTASSEEKASEGAKYVAPRTPLEKQITEIWEATLGVSNISIRDSFFDLGGRSLSAMRIITKINKAYSTDFGLATLFSGKTIERMAELIQNRLSPNTTSSIVPMQPLGTAAPLFIIHGAGGNIIRFYPLAMLVGTDHPIYGVQAQSLLSHQSALLRMEDLAAYYLSEIRKIQPKGPYYFLGYSFGGTVAYEMAQQLRAVGERVGLLGMLDTRHSHFMAGMFRKDSVRTRFDRRFGRFTGNIANLSFQEKTTYLWEKFWTRTLRNAYNIATTLGFRSVPSFMKSADDISWVAAVKYQTHPYPGRVTLFRASEQPDPRLPKDLGWKDLVQGGMEICELPGDHDRIFLDPNIQNLAKQLQACLERTDAVEARTDEQTYTYKK